MTQGNEAWRVCNAAPGCRSVWYRPRCEQARLAGV
jgi:hypothetical protein